MAIPWAPIITTGLSLLSGLFGKKKKEQPQVQTVQNEVDYVKMAANAEAAGFNPLTALRNGGAAGFSRSTGTVTGGGTSGPSLSSVVVGAVSDGFNSWLNHDPFKEKRAQAEYDLMQAQLGHLADQSAESRQRQQSFNVPVRQASQSVEGTGLAGRPANSGGVTGLPIDPEQGKRTVTNPWQVSVVDPQTSDAAVFEERYGGSELAETEAYLRTRLADVRANLRNSITGNAAVPIAPFLWDRAMKSRDKAIKRDEQHQLKQMRQPISPYRRFNEVR